MTKEIEKNARQRQEVRADLASISDLDTVDSMRTEWFQEHEAESQSLREARLQRNSDTAATTIPRPVPSTAESEGKGEVAGGQGS